MARLILDQKSLRDRTGKRLGILLTVNMNTLFERFVEKTAGREARLQLVAQASRRLPADVPLRPDLVLRAGGRDLAVGDAKYKEPDERRPPNEDLYQLLAYCVSLGLTRGLLIYSGEFDGQYLVQRAGITLEATSVDLTGELEQIEASARKAARRLLEHAGTADVRQNISHKSGSYPEVKGLAV